MLLTNLEEVLEMKSSRRPFDWKKSLKREYQGILGFLFQLLFFVVFAAVVFIVYGLNGIYFDEGKGAILIGTTIFFGSFLFVIPVGMVLLEYIEDKLEK